ncbi:Ig-like domain-containing protein [Curtobacterium aurantiacum]|uniref:Tandem-95 repeat protein n=1 Tax=Curtobacterium aurantiacum TaxID=3236919 RepID=A0ABS5VC85_9MICO|nr:Ig-like domain-containing protein [Curtobacterium flaccumfaciens]MBT1544323.1 tandem-95 repeat protein [Curtobacterium flaccumfaciens pv. flaccumfaciens]MBT1587098.1 tandem-95 repeat protein [Curtobacterium flaccumfaciens pv. flaccumfaciens]
MQRTNPGTAVPTDGPDRPAGTRRPGLRAVAVLGAALLVGTGLTATSAVVAAAPASAVSATKDGALVCTPQETLYAIDGTGKVVAVDISTGASRGTTADVTNLGTGANNGLGISREGVSMFAASNNQTATLRQFDPKTGVASAPVATESVRSVIRGAVNPVTGIYYYGSNKGWLGAYGPKSGKYLGQVGQIDGLKDGNGDFAFSSRGLFFVVASDTVYRVNTDAVPTASGTTAMTTSAIATLPAGTNSPGIAFSSDGYLYVSNTPTNSTVTTIYQLDPTSGKEVRNFRIAGDFAASDLASCNYADTVTGAASVDQRWNSGDQFALAISGGGIDTTKPGSAGTTSGSATGVQAQKAGAVLTTPNKDYTVKQTAAGTTDLANYDTTWKAVDQTTGTTVASGTGTTGTFTFPAATTADGTDVLVTFTNTLKATHVTTSSDTATTPTGTALSVPAASGVLANDQGTGLSVVSNTTPTHGTATVAADGSYTYTPAGGFSGSDTFQYTAKDSSGQTSTSTVTVTVAPKGSDDAYSVHAGTVLKVDAADGVLTNDRGSDLTLTGHGQPSNGLVKIAADGSFSYGAEKGYSGPDSFTYTAKDGSGATVTATVRLTVLPTATADAVTATAGATATGNVLANDLGTGLTVTGNRTPAHGSATVRPDGSYSYTPSAGFSGTDSFTYTVTDGSGGTETVTVTVQVAPAAQDDTVKVAAGGTATAGTRATGVLGNDSGAGLTVASNTTPSHGALTLDGATGTFTYTPAEGYSGPDAFTYTAVDGSGSPSTATVTITVNPTIGADTASTNARTPVTIDVQGNDRGSDLGTTIATGPTHGTAVVATDGAIEYTPTAGFSGTDSFTYTVTDGSGVTTGAATVTITVRPVATGDTVSTKAGEALSIAPAALTGNDQGAGLTLTGVTAGSGTGADGTGTGTDGTGTGTDGSTGTGTVVLDQATGRVVYTPASGFSGTDTFTYTVTDAAGRSTTGTVTVVVGPRATADTATATAGSTLTVAKGDGVLANDRGTGLTAAVDQQPAHGTVELAANGSYTYTPKDGFSGTATFTYTATDPSGRTTTGTVTVTVRPGTEPDTITVAAGGSTTVTSGALTGNDHGTGLTVVSVSGGKNGTATRNDDGTITYTPKDGFSGTDTVTYTVTDPSGNTNTGTVTVTVTPVAGGGSTSAEADATTTVPAGTGLLDGAKGTDLAVTDHTKPGHGDVEVGKDGSYTYKPEPGYSGPDGFDYTVTDGSGTPATGTVTIVVAPKAAADTATTSAATPVDVAVTGNDSGTKLAVTAVSQPGHGTATITGGATGGSTTTPGNVTFTPAEGFSGTDTFTYTVTDPTGGTATATVTVTVTPTAVADALRTAANTALPISGATLTGNDHGTGLAVTAHGRAEHGTVIEGTEPGSLVFTPEKGFSGADTFEYTVTDGAGRTSTATVTVVVGVAAVDHWRTMSTNRSMRMSADRGVLVGDSGRGLWAAMETKPLHGALALEKDGSYVYEPTSNWSGRDWFTYSANDSAGTAAFALVVIDVTPAAKDDRATTTAGTTVRVAGHGVLGNDHGDALTVVAVGQARHGTASIAADGTFVYTPATGFSGTDTVTYRAQDSMEQQVDATVTITVGIAAADDSGHTVSGTPVTRDARHGLLADDQGTGLTAAPARKPAHGTVAIQRNGAYVYTPAAGFTGTDTFTYTVTDASGQRATATATMTVVAAAVATDDSATGIVGHRVVVDPLDNDSATGGATFESGTLHLLHPESGTPTDRVVVADQGTWTIRDGRVVFTPQEGFTGTTFVGYMITDSAGQTVTATITVTFPTGLAAIVHGAELAFTGVTGLVGLGLAALALMLAGVLLVTRRRIAVRAAPGIRRSARP